MDRKSAKAGRKLICGRESESSRMIAMDPALAIGLRPAARRPPWRLSSSACSSTSQVTGGRRRHGGKSFPGGGGGGTPERYGMQHRSMDGCCSVTSRASAFPENSSSVPDPPKRSSNGYHPFEEMGELALPDDGKDAHLSDAETARTIIEVNSKATLMFSGLVEEEIHESIIWSDLSYLTDEYGDIYFEMKDEDLLQTLVADDKLVQVIIGIDNVDMLTEMEESGPSNVDFGIEDISNEGSDMDDDYEEDVSAVLEDDEDDMSSDDELNNWSNLETVNSSHPMYFAKKMAEVVSNVHFDWMEQPSASIVVQGLLRPAFIEEHSFGTKHTFGHNAWRGEINHVEEAVEDNTEQGDTDHSLHSGTTFYKLEAISIQLLSAYGSQTVVKVQDFRKAQPDIIAHSTVNIIARVRSGGEATTQALKSLCWRCKGIHVEEAVLAGVDSLGFDLRVCSGTQVQTLRFAFNTQATSELSAEKQLRDVLFPRLQHKHENRKQAHQKEG